MPDQSTFTMDEAECLVQLALAWANEQIKHEVEECKYAESTIDEMVAGGAFVDTKDALTQTEDLWEDAMLSIGTHIATWMHDTLE